MEILTVFLGAIAGVVIGSAVVETVKTKVKTKEAMKELEETTVKARQMLANLADDFKDAVEPKENENETQETR
jgi:tryptophan synthase alpha subunit